MICPNCGKNNKDKNNFCTGCGTKLSLEVEIAPSAQIKAYEEETVSLQDASVFEDEETVILDDLCKTMSDDSSTTEDIDAFEDEETVILSDLGKNEENCSSETEDLMEADNDVTVILDSDKPSEEEVIPDLHEAKVPDYQFREIYKEPPSKLAQETEYIDHLRALKQLLDDGIITEDEFTQKKKQILGI